MGADEIMDFEQTLSRQAHSQSGMEGGPGGEARDEVKLIEESTFEELLSMCKDEFEEKDEFKVDGVSKRNKDKNVEKVVESLKNKEKQLLGLDKQILRSGFLVFEDRISKLKMMNTPLFLFGMKLFRQTGHLEFFDADFCNTIIIKQDDFVDLTLREVCGIINEMLQKTGFEGDLLKIGKLKDLGDEFDLGKILVRSGYQITLRFNNFEEALKAFKCLNRVDDSSRKL